jgi:CO dehydrogenase nickel-insertion accessory protein CooC1
MKKDLKIIVVGEANSGKTSLAKLLSDFLESKQIEVLNIDPDLNSIQLKDRHIKNRDPRNGEDLFLKMLQSKTKIKIQQQQVYKNIT